MDDQPPTKRVKLRNEPLDAQDSGKQTKNSQTETEEKLKTEFEKNRSKIFVPLKVLITSKKPYNEENDAFI